MENPQIQLVEATLDQKLSRLARKYSDEIIVQTLHEIRMNGEEDEFLRTCGWKAEMSLTEALGCLQEYCEFVEMMIRKHLEKETTRPYLPAFFN